MDFLDQICPRRVITVKKIKSEHYHWILHIRISLGTKFHFKQFWILGSNLSRKSIFSWIRKNWTWPLSSWYGKTRVTSYELRVESLKARVEIQKFWTRKNSKFKRFELAIHELWVQIYELRVLIHESRVQIHELRIQIQISLSQWKTQVNSLNSSSVLKIISPKLWGNSYVQFLMIISCFTFPPLHGHDFSKKVSE